MREVGREMGMTAQLMGVRVGATGVTVGLMKVRAQLTGVRVRVAETGLWVKGWGLRSTVGATAPRKTQWKRAAERRRDKLRAVELRKQ